eukprot:SAG31_NODE_1180_length_9525_cov_4.989497_6_plen_415_part_00
MLVRAAAAAAAATMAAALAGPSVAVAALTFESTEPRVDSAELSGLQCWPVFTTFQPSAHPTTIPSPSNAHSLSVLPAFPALPHLTTRKQGGIIIEPNGCDEAGVRFSMKQGYLPPLTPAPSTPARKTFCTFKSDDPSGAGNSEPRRSHLGSAEFSVAVDWSGSPLAVSPAISSWHDTALGASGNPHHDDIYPPSRFDIVKPVEEARRQLRAPYVRLWSGTDYFYKWPNSTRVTAVGPAISPPNTTETCRFNFPSCSCCREYCAADCSCCQVPPNTSWDFGALDINVASLQSSTAFPETNILQIVGVGGNWFFKPGKYMSIFADPSGSREGRWFSNILDWYCRGGFTDERGAYHHSGHNYTFGYLELLNEMDLLAGENYIRWYDGVVAVVKARHPTIKFIGAHSHSCCAFVLTSD